MLRLFNEGIARSDSDDDDEQTIDAILYVVLRSQPDAVR